MGIRMGGLASGIDPKLVDKLIEVERQPVEAAKKRKENVVTEKKEFEKLQTALSELDTALNGLKTRTDFYKLKLESSHPDIIDGVVKANAMLGSYEFEVRSLAKADKQLAYGFPDKDKTEVGFGYMQIEREDKDPAELVIEPGSTLVDVAKQINDAEIGVRAMVVNTKYKPDSYRLLVISEQSGKEAKINIDEDTTFLEFKNQVAGRNLDVLFEDVPITSEDNNITELLDDVTLTAKRSEPGTRVQVNIVHDNDATLKGIRSFVDKYNGVSGFIHGQFVVDKDKGRAGILAADGSIKSVMRQLQSSLGNMVSPVGKFHTLADIGIITEAKTGNLQMDDAKVKAALAEDYDSVAALFIRGRNSVGIAERMAQELKNFRDPGNGILRSRLRGLDDIIKNQDKNIEERERMLGQREEAIRRRFTALESQMSGLQAQSSFLGQKFGGDSGPQGGGGGT